MLQKPAPTGVPWNTKPELSGKKPGSYEASTGISMFGLQVDDLHAAGGEEAADDELRDQKVV